MALEAFDQQAAEGINAAFMRNHRGEVCIAFTDPTYARADMVLVDKNQRAVHVMVRDNVYFISQVSESMMQAFESNEQALLTAIRSDGTLLESTAPIEAGAA